MTDARGASVDRPEDMFNREIKVGDICVYPVRRGSKMWMNVITIMRILKDAKGDYKINGVKKKDGYPVTVSSLDRVAVIGRNNMIPSLE